MPARLRSGGDTWSWSASSRRTGPPERFAAIHAAYEALRDPARRLQSQIFQCETTVDSLETLATDLRRRLRDTRLPVASLLNLADSP